MPSDITLSLSDIDDGGAKIIEGGPDFKIALFRVGQKVAAIANRCPHAGAPLGRGPFNGVTVKCPLHGFTVDVWRGIGSAGKPVKTYPVTVQDNTVVISIPD